MLVLHDILHVLFLHRVRCKTGQPGLHDIAWSDILNGIVACTVTPKQCVM